MTKRKIFVDSDVALSSFISTKGAAHFLLNEADLNLFISNISLTELERGIDKLNLNKEKLKDLVKNRSKTVKLKETLGKIKADFRDYVFDENDAHIVAGAKKAKARLILSYNIKHFNIPKLKKDFNMVIKTPAQYLQYLRSLQ